MKNLFGNFQLIPNDQKGYIEELEKKYNISLPPIFKAFNQTFIINSLKPDQDHHLYHLDEELGFEKFDFSIIEIIKLYLDVGEPHKTYKMLPIATSSMHSGGICVCLDDLNNDKIFINDEMSSEQFTLIANDILDFISQIKQFNYLEN